MYQKKWLKQKAGEMGLNVTKIFKEERSAKKPDSRPVFSEMLGYIEQGKADGVLCWQINRLSRNPIDSAKIQWMRRASDSQSAIVRNAKFAN